MTVEESWLNDPEGKLAARSERECIGFDAVPQAGTGDAVCVTLDEDGDVGRGDVLSDRAAALDTAEQFHAHVVWGGSRSLIAGRPYWLKLAHRTVGTTITSIRHLVDPDSGEHIAAHDAAANAIAAVHLSVDSPLPFAPYAENCDLGGFLLIDRMTQATAGAGMIDFALRRDRNLRWQDLSVDRAARAALKGQKPMCVWFTGLSGSGKSTWPACSIDVCTTLADILTCSTATTCATGSTATWASPRPTVWKTCGGWPR